MKSDGDVLNADEVAVLLKAHIETVRRLARRGEIPAFKIGRDWRFSKEALLRWVDDHSSGSKGPSILIAEDDEATSNLLRRFLEAEGYVCHQVSNGVEGLKYLEAETVDLILCDLEMPRMNGPEFLWRLSEAGYQLPVIVITGYPDGKLMAEAMRYGPITLVAKPFEREPIMRVVRAALNSAGFAPMASLAPRL